MAIATGTVVVDGHTYKKNEEIPDLGSLVCTSFDGNIRNYDGKYADRYKLPKYDDLGTGSSAFLSDSGNFYLFMYFSDSRTWEGNGEVI